MRDRQKFFAILLIAALISGCSTLPRRGARVFTFKPNKWTAVQSEFEIPQTIDYRIGADDLLEVDIWKHPDLSKEVIVRPDGKISYLLIGDVQAQGLTVQELDDAITRKFEEYAKELEKREVIDSPPVRKEYRIGLSDGLDISVWKVPDLSVYAIVRPDGKISYPLLGDMQAYGKTFTELDDELTEKLRKYIKDPQVSIMIKTFGEMERRRVTFVTEFITTFLEERPEISILVKRFGSRKVIVMGQVKTPGFYDLIGNARLLDAIAYAGDFTDTAVKDNIFVIRGDIYSNPQVIKINAWDIIKHGNFKANIPIQNQDIIYVPRSIVGNINVFMTAIQPTIKNLYDAALMKTAVRSALKLD